MPKSEKQRKRLAPEERQSSILDHAAKIVAERGVSGVTMERVAKAAGVSKSLVYVYFPSTTEMLRALLQRELKALRIKQMEAERPTRTFGELVRAVTHAYLSHIKDHGPLITRLQSEPSVAQGTGDPTDYSRNKAVQMIAEIVSDVYELPMELTIPATSISFGIPVAAGNYLHSADDVDFQTIEDLTVSMIIGSVEVLHRNYATMLKPIHRDTDSGVDKDKPDLKAL